MLSMNDWDEVDGALEKIGEIDLEVAEITTEACRKLREALGDYCTRIKELGGMRAGIESEVMAFCLLKKSEFARKRSRRFQYGKIAFRTAERIEISDELQAAAIATLKRLGLTECIELKERLDKSALKKLADADLARCGIKRLREDHFRIEPDLGIISEKLGKTEHDTQFSPGGAAEKLISLLADVGEPKKEWDN